MTRIRLWLTGIHAYLTDRQRPTIPQLLALTYSTRRGRRR